MSKQTDNDAFILAAQKWLGVKQDGWAGVATMTAFVEKTGQTPGPVAGVRQINAAGLAVIKEYEGLRLTSYPDPATNGDPWTIGWGHTGPDVYKGLTITEAKAAQLLFKDLKRFEAAVAKLAPVATDNQFSAMVSLAFNVGEANFGKSTLLRKHNAGDYAGAKSEFARWNLAAGKVMAGLTRRRAAEADLYGR